ncbi:MAG: hypothetical protein ABI724_05525 [Betaproteobacteria bacterium]
MSAVAIAAAVAAAAAAAAAADPLPPPQTGDLMRRLRDAFDTLPPELCRAARWMSDHFVALTDSALSPLARRSSNTLLFRTESLSFFPSMIAPLALVELLLARLAARGGRKVLDRLAEVEKRLSESRAYWPESARGVRA